MSSFQQTLPRHCVLTLGAHRDQTHFLPAPDMVKQGALQTILNKQQSIVWAIFSLIILITV